MAGESADESGLRARGADTDLENQSRAHPALALATHQSHRGQSLEAGDGHCKRSLGLVRGVGRGLGGVANVVGMAMAGEVLDDQSLCDLWLEERMTGVLYLRPGTRAEVGPDCVDFVESWHYKVRMVAFRQSEVESESDRDLAGHKKAVGIVPSF